MSSSPAEPLFDPTDRFWEDPSLTERNRLRSRPPLASHGRIEAARAAPSLWQAVRLNADEPGGRFARSLDGEWGFAHFDRPEAVPASAVANPVVAGATEAPIEVPGAWTLQGWDSPIYTNVQMPFPGKAPLVPADNPTGVYRRTLEVDVDWAGRDVILSLGGAESLAVVYLDGVFVGLGTDSRLGSEFDLTPFVEVGRSHLLAVVVIRWSAATWIEDQDQWWHGGIQGSVTLWSRPAVHLDDVGMVPGLAVDGTTGTLNVDITIGGDLGGGLADGSTDGANGPAEAGGAGPGDPQVTRILPASRWWVGVSVEQLDGTALLESEPVEVTAFDEANALARLLASDTWPGQMVRTSLEVPGIEAWSDERPTRYRVLVQLWQTASDAGPPDSAVEPIEVAAVLTGFRSVEVGGRELRINGAAPLIRGVNRHEHSPTRGRYVDPETTWFELCLAKRLNVNAVRTAHAPAAPWFYDFCDELGLYVVDETNVESHGRQVSLTTQPGFTGAVIERGLRMAGRDRNHPCVIVWSLGNEAGEGPAHHGLAGALRYLDPSRPLSYEGPIMFDLDADNPVSDLVAPMYRSVEEITAWAKSRKDRRRPLILCEYSHAMGNSNGGLDDYWRAFRTHHGLQGGFVWEWRDHGLVRGNHSSASAEHPAGDGGIRRHSNHLSASAEHPAGDGGIRRHSNHLSASAEHPAGDGETRWGYGGDFGEQRHDGNFVFDGLLGPDLVPHPACIELAHLQRSLHLEGVDVRLGHLRLHNERSFTDTSDVVGTWQLVADGVGVADGTWDVPQIEPGSEAKVTVPVPPDLTRWSGQELALTAELALATSTSWGPEGHVVARHQFELPAETAPRRHGAVTTGSAEVLCERMDDRWSLGDGSWGLDVDRHLGVVGLSRSGHPLLVNRPGHSLWRAPIDNDGMKTAWMSGFGHQDRWRQVGLDSVDGPQTRRLDRVTVRRREDGVAAVLTGVLVPRRQDGGDGPEPPECPITERWWLRGDGTISIDVTWRLPEELADPPRIGLVLALDPSFDQLESSGLGPHECPPDRIEGAVLGRYRRRASEERCPYVVPQCFGQRAGTRWLSAAAPDRGTWIITGEQPFVHTAHRYSEGQLTRALHADALEQENSVFVHLDAAHRGVGTASCGPDTAARHRIAAGTHRLGLTLSWTDSVTGQS